ncbi:MAG: acyltransferase [Ectothiorhodospiraceae bacterium]|nr:acyltransferase [Ectothiorhodospiraceae bacterium]
MTAPRVEARDHYASVDGLRAFAVAAVLLYHHDTSWLPGGYLGVEVFFVISGFIITSQLQRRYDRQGSVDYPLFVTRRCLRLMPGMLAMLVATWFAVASSWPEELAKLRADTVPALTFLQNWQLVVNQQSYFEAMDRPRLLQHLWSLGVEFQFYLLWPPLLLACLWLPRLLQPLVTLVAAAGLYCWMALLAADLAGEDPSRIYLGTDTRVGAIVLGAALAQAMRAWPAAARASALPGIAPVTMLGLVALHWSLDDTADLLYQGGLAATALLTALTIAATLGRAHGVVARLLASRAMTVVGTRAYSLYLWHWPVFCLTMPHVDVGLDGPALLAMRLGLTCVLSELSYRVIEMPFRDGHVLRALRRIWANPSLRPGLIGSAGLYGGVAGIMGFVLLVPATAREQVGPTGSSLAVAALEIEAETVSARRVAIAPVRAVVVSPVPEVDAVVERRVDREAAGLAETATLASSTASSQLALGAGLLDDARGFVVAAGSAAIADALAAAEALADRSPPSAAPVVSRLASGGAAATIPLGNPDPATAPDIGDLTTTPPPAALAAPGAGCFASGAAGGPSFAVEHGERWITRRYPADAAKRSVYAVGDSVMLGAIDAMVKSLGDVDVDARVARQLTEGIALIEARARDGILSDVVVVHLGNNGPFRERDLDRLMRALADVPRVLLVNLKLPRSYESRNNASLEQLASDPRVSVLDWRATSLDGEGVFGRDGIHLTAKGARLFADAIAGALCPAVALAR